MTDEFVTNTETVCEICGSEFNAEDIEFSDELELYLCLDCEEAIRF